MKHVKQIGLILMLSFSLSGCISTIVGAAVDTTIAVVKVPFKVGGAVLDVVKGDPDKADANNGDSDKHNNQTNKQESEQ